MNINIELIGNVHSNTELDLNDIPGLISCDGNIMEDTEVVYDINISKLPPEVRKLRIKLIPAD